MSVERFSLNQKVTGRVISFTQPYFEVMVDEQLARVFIKNMDTKFLDGEQAAQFIGQELDFIVEEIVENAESNYPGLILNRRIILEEAIKKAIEALNVGDVLMIDDIQTNKGGLNFSYNNIRGFIPLKEISYKFYATSEEGKKEIELPVAVKITSIELVGGIYNIVGSIKANLESPMERIKDLKIGDDILIHELVANKGGANFVFNETRGFVPLKDLSHEFNHNAVTAIEKMEFPVKVKVTEIEDKGPFVNIIGSVRANSLTPAEIVANINIGDQITINNLSANAGGLCFSYKTVRGFIPLSEVSHKFFSTSESALSDVELPTKILITEISENRGQLNIIGSIRANLDDLYTIFTNTYQLNDLIDAKIVRQEEYGYIIEFDNGFRTLLHITQFNDDIKNVEHVVGDVINVKLINILDSTKQVQVTTLRETIISE